MTDPAAAGRELQHPEEAMNENNNDTNPAGQAINDFADLYPRRIGGNTYRVLSLSDGEPTAYKVNIQTPECSCEDYQYNEDGSNICKHLAAAIYQAPAHPSLEREVFENVTRLYGEMADAVSDIKDVRDVAQTTQNATAQAAVEQSGGGQESQQQGSSGQQRPDDFDPVEEVESWLADGFAKPDMVDVRLGDHDNVAGVVMEPENQEMGDAVYESFKSYVNSADATEMHTGFGDDGCYICDGDDGEFWYFLPSDSIGEVV